MNLSTSSQGEDLSEELESNIFCGGDLGDFWVSVKVNLPFRWHEKASGNREISC